MACNLELSPTGDVDFVGPSGESVTLTLTGPDGVAAEIVHIRYAGTGTSNPPFTFDIKDGTNLLVVLAEASQAGAILQFKEDCGGSDQVLSTFHFDPQNPARGYFIKGTPGA
jgi:hypothetical protein